MKLHKFENSAYRQIFKIHKVEWCSFMSGKARSNYMMNFIINTIKDSTSKQLFHKCPYQGRFELLNITMKSDSHFSIYPRGQYRLDIKLYDEGDAEMFSVAVEMKIDG